jgi:pimeloyl-ACP methyl ester carboxylesterase
VTEKPATLRRGETVTIAYHHHPGARPGVIFCPGFKSDMAGTKASALDRFCRSRGQQYTRFDYQGHGKSSGEFINGTIGEWLADTLAVLDRISEGPQIMVGSSMGGWIALLAACARPGRIVGLVGIAAAVDMTKRLWERLDDDARDQLRTEGLWMRPSEYDPAGYPVTMHLIEEGRNHLLFPGPIPFEGPVRLLHGQRDDAVPWELSLETAKALRSERVDITLVKDGDHRLSRAEDIDRILRAVGELTDLLASA